MPVAVVVVVLSKNLKYASNQEQLDVIRSGEAQDIGQSVVAIATGAHTWRIYTDSGKPLSINI